MFSHSALLYDILSLAAVVNFVQKDFLGSISEFRNQYVIPIQNGQHQDASRRDVIMMKRRVKHLLEYALLAAVALFL
jgi:hypothetical protein